MHRNRGIYGSVFDYSNNNPIYNFQNSQWLTERLQLDASLKFHQGCVNSLCWAEDHSTTILLSGSDDKRLVLTDVFKRKQILTHKTTHGDNIFSARFMPNSDNKKVISGAGDGTVLLTNFEHIADRQPSIYNCACQSGPVYECRPIDQHLFLTCAEDGCVRRYDLRMCSGCCQGSRVNPLTRIFGRIGVSTAFSGRRQNTCYKHALIALKNCSATSIDVADNRNNFELAVGCSDGRVRLYDTRNCKRPFAHYSYPCIVRTRSQLPRRRCKVTCVRYNETNTELLINFSGNQLHLVSPIESSPISRYNQVTTTDETENEFKDQDELRRIKRLRADWTSSGAIIAPISTRDPAVVMQSLGTVLDNLSTSSSSSDNEETTDNLRSVLQRIVGSLERQSVDESNSSEPDYDDDEEEEENIHPTRTRRSARLSAQSSIPSDSMPLNLIRKFTGHRNLRTIIKECAFYGDKFVVCGSDCGHLFLWDKFSGDVVGIHLADQHVVNCVQPHPLYPIIATSGIDHDIKIWVPSGNGYNENRQWEEIIQRNEEMLGESRETITVLDPLLLGLLASISRARVANDTSSNHGEDSTSNQQSN